MYGTIFLIFIIWLVLGAIAVVTLRLDFVRRRVQDRLQNASSIDSDTNLSIEDSRSWYSWWLYRAGYRSRKAPLAFTLVLLFFAALAGTTMWLIQASGLVQTASDLLYLVPGGVGEVFLPLAWAAPWIGGACLIAIPIMIVRANRRRRVTAIEQDLPVTLDLLATLAESGLGFDSALDKILKTEPKIRPLGQDMRVFQVDILAGRSRIEALRRLKRRVDVAWFSIFISAVIHAEQIGSGLAQTLRVQADDLRNRRRERVLALTMSIPVKLVLPLVICFLPGIMLAAIGPTAYQILRVMDQSVLQQGFGSQP
jgi:tight adherence protein C